MCRLASGELSHKHAYLEIQKKQTNESCHQGDLSGVEESSALMDRITLRSTPLSHNYMPSLDVATSCS